MKLFDRVKGKTISELVEIAKKAKKDPYGMVKDKSVGELKDMVKFSKGGIILGPGGIRLSSISNPLPSPGPPRIQFRRGGKIKKGSPAMKRKMAMLRAMRK
jgi:hypothetical protein